MGQGADSPGRDGRGGTLGAIEIAPVHASSKGARLLLADARVVAPEPLGAFAGAPSAKSAVLVVLGSTAPRQLAPYGGSHAVPELSALARSGIVFESHRAPTSIAAGALTSMFTGLPPRTHTVEDPDARLPHGVTTIADCARQGGVRTALFTENPTTGPAFGFDRGWETYVAHAPNEDLPPTQVFDDAAKYIEQHKDGRFLVVVHARGGHPPWDVTAEELKALAPANYNGTLNPRRAAETLTRQRKYPQRFKEEDRARVWALYANALDQHDLALGRLLAALKNSGRDVDTTVVVTGDVSVNEGAAVPFVDDGSLDEGVLAVPLVVKAPGGALAGKRVAAPTTSLDVARTLMATLGLAPPATFRGSNLFEIASGDVRVSERPLLATTAARFAARWGSFVLSGTREHETKLCDLVLEPTCVTDVRRTYPLATEALHRFAQGALGPDGGVPLISREAGFLDPTTMASLLAWGRPAEKERGKRKRGE